MNPKHCECGAQGFIVDSRQRNDYVCRRYECREKSCNGVSWSTVEFRLCGNITPDQIPAQLAKQFSGMTNEIIADKLIALAQELLHGKD